MKKLFLILAIGATFTACKSDKDKMDTNKDLLLLTDSSNLNGGNYLTDTGMATVEVVEEPVAVAPATRAPARTTSTRRSSSSSSGNGTVSNNNTGTSGSTGTQTTTKRDGMSNAAKGAIIGGVGGAVGGAVIGKNVKGAAVGAAVGAAGGYIIGRSKDKKQNNQ